MTLGRKLSEARHKAGKSLRQVEKATGVSNETICQIETGWVENPSFLTVVKLAKYYGIELEELTK